MTKNTEKLSLIAIKIEQVQRNIADLEHVLKSTTSPANDIIAELKMLKDVRSFYLNQYDSVSDES